DDGLAEAQGLAWLRGNADSVLVDAAERAVERTVREPEAPLARHPAAGEAAPGPMVPVRMPERPLPDERVALVLTLGLESKTAVLDVREVRERLAFSRS